MLLVTTEGTGSMDRYSQALAEHLNVPVVTTDIYQEIAERFNVPLFSRSSLEALRADWRFVRFLRSLAGPLHLPNHHLGRYGRFLTQPYIVTVHDLIRYFDTLRKQPYIHLPNQRDRLLLSMDYAGIRQAEAVIAVSRATRFDLISHLGIPEERIFVVYEGVDHNLFRPVEARPFDHPYLLFVGSEHPRKNLGELLEALALLKASGRFPGLKLVKVGKAGGAEAAFREMTLRQIRQSGLDDDVVLAGRVPDDELPGYYSGAAAVVLPSLYEGFGLPALEALACGAPLVVSSAGALPEVVGDAGVQVSPHAPDLLAAALERVLSDEPYRQELRQRGFARAAEFSWERMARETGEVYQEVERRLAARRWQGLGAAERDDDGHAPAAPQPLPSSRRTSSTTARWHSVRHTSGVRGQGGTSPRGGRVGLRSVRPAEDRPPGTVGNETATD